MRASGYLVCVLGVTGMFGCKSSLTCFEGMGERDGRCVVDTKVQASQATAAPPTVEPAAKPASRCPSGYLPMGRRDCFSVDSISSGSRANRYDVEGEVISTMDCSSVSLTLSGHTEAGRQICYGHGKVEELTAGESEAWEGQLWRCSEPPETVRLRIWGCRRTSE